MTSQFSRKALIPSLPIGLFRYALCFMVIFWCCSILLLHRESAHIRPNALSILLLYLPSPTVLIRLDRVLTIARCPSICRKGGFCARPDCNYLGAYDT